jgi:hypothetical protein
VLPLLRIEGYCWKCKGVADAGGCALGKEERKKGSLYCCCWLAFAPSCWSCWWRYYYGWCMLTVHRDGWAATNLDCNQHWGWIELSVGGNVVDGWGWSLATVNVN